MKTEKAPQMVVSSSVATGLRKPGEFCWFNMITPRPAEACEFFGALLGWRFSAVPGMRDGRTVLVDSHPVGAIWDQHAPDTPKGTPAFIGVSILVDSADTICAKVTANGGTARPAFDVMEAGRMSVCTDPTGAQFDVWQPKKHLGTDVDNRLVGAPSWFELRTGDADRAAAFYESVFGWKPAIVAQEGMRYTSFEHAGRYVAGMVQCPEAMKVPTHWSAFFNTDDPDDAAREAERLGATIQMPPTDIPGVGRFCILGSPQGVTFQIIKYSRA